MQKYAYRGHAFEKSRGRPLIRAIHNKSFFDSENFSSLAKFAFQNKRPLLKKQNGASSFFAKILLRFLQEYYLKKELYFGKINPFSDQSQGDAWGIVISELTEKHLFLFCP